MIEIKEYSIYDEEEILALYSSVGWTAYTDRPDTLKMGLKTHCYVWQHMKAVR